MCAPDILNNFYLVAKSSGNKTRSKSIIQELNRGKKRIFEVIDVEICGRVSKIRKCCM